MFDHPYFIPAVLGSFALIQVVLLVALLRLSSKVSRLFQLIASPVPQSAKDLADRKEASGDQKRWFNEFLSEEPSRRELPKKEQFAEFRQWREEKGLNWSGK